MFSPLGSVPLWWSFVFSSCVQSMSRTALNLFSIIAQFGSSCGASDVRPTEQSCRVSTYGFTRRYHHFNDTERSKCELPDLHHTERGQMPPLGKT